MVFFKNLVGRPTVYLRSARGFSSTRFASAQTKLFRVQDRRFNFLMIMLVGVVSSELMWIIRTRNETERVSRNLNTELKIMDGVIERLNKGEKVDVEKELLLAAKDQEDISLDAILSQIEETDSNWKKASSKLPTAPVPAPASPETSKKPESGSKGASSSSFL